MSRSLTPVSPGARPDNGLWQTSRVAAAICLLLVLAWLASAIVRHAMATQSAADHAALLSGSSPWRWPLARRDDLVAGRLFGAGELREENGALVVQSRDGSPIQFGLPLGRPPNLRDVPVFVLNASASAPGAYAVTVRETLTSPGASASLGTLAGNALSRAFLLNTLAWEDAAGDAVPAPRKVAMLRLTVTLPAGQSLTLRRAALVPGPSTELPASIPIPADLSAEQLLVWRDHARDDDSLASFGNERPAPRPSRWQPWWVPVAYFVLLCLRHFVPLRRAERYLGDPLDTVLVLAGPVAFIATLGFSMHPAPAGIVTFALGVAYAAALAARRRLPAWRWFGTWHRHVFSPLIAVGVAGGLAYTLGHAPVWPPVSRALVYLGWAVFQQWLMLAVVAGLLARALPRPVAVLATAFAFALLHTPNGRLMQLCFIAEIGWAWWYLRHRALLPVAIAHAASALILQACLTGDVLRSLEVGGRFLGI